MMAPATVRTAPTPAPTLTGATMQSSQEKAAKGAACSSLHYGRPDDAAREGVTGVALSLGASDSRASGGETADRSTCAPTPAPAVGLGWERVGRYRPPRLAFGPRSAAAILGTTPSEADPRPARLGGAL